MYSDNAWLQLKTSVQKFKNYNEMQLSGAQLAQSIQGRIYSKPGPVQKKTWGPQAPNTIIGLLLSPTVVVELASVSASVSQQYRPGYAGH